MCSPGSPADNTHPERSKPAVTRPIACHHLQTEASLCGCPEPLHAVPLGKSLLELKPLPPLAPCLPEAESAGHTPPQLLRPSLSDSPGSSVSRGGAHGPLLFPLLSLKPGFSFCLSLAALILAIPGAVIKVSSHFPEGRPLLWPTDDRQHREEPESEKDRGCLEVRAHGCNSRPSPRALRQGLGAVKPSSCATVHALYPGQWLSSTNHMGNSLSEAEPGDK